MARTRFGASVPGATALHLAGHPPLHCGGAVLRFMACRMPWMSRRRAALSKNAGRPGRARWACVNGTAGQKGRPVQLLLRRRNRGRSKLFSIGPAGRVEIGRPCRGAERPAKAVKWQGEPSAGAWRRSPIGDGPTSTQRSPPRTPRTSLWARLQAPCVGPKRFNFGASVASSLRQSSVRARSASGPPAKRLPRRHGVRGR
jgi:hypothetical protein